MVTYRLATAEDYININEFHNRIDKPYRSIEQFYWEFRDGPIGASIYVVAEDGDKIVGTNCVIPINLIDSNGKFIKSGKSEDTLVDPSYRGQNIFNNIYEFLFEECKKHGVSVIWGFTSANKPFEKLGFEIPYDHQQGLAVNQVLESYKFLKTLNPKNKFKDKIKIFGLCLFSKLKFKLNILPDSSEFQLSEIEGKSSISESLIQSNLEKYPNSFAIHQNESFQHWRIYSNPNYFKTNTFIFKNSEGQIIALFETNTTKSRVSYINQSSFSSDISELEKAKMIRMLTKFMFKRGVKLVRSWLFNTNELNKNEIQFFEKAGHFYLKRGISLVWKKLDDNDLNVFDFYLSRIASQGIQ